MYVRHTQNSIHASIHTVSYKATYEAHWHRNGGEGGYNDPRVLTFPSRISRPPVMFTASIAGARSSTLLSRFCNHQRPV